MKLTLLRSLLLVATGLSLLRPAMAQVLPDVLFTVGTTWRDSQNRDWSYIALQPAEPGLLQARKLAVYAKPGAADSNAPYERKAILAVQTDPAILTTILNRAQNLGDPVPELGERLDELFGELVPAPALSLPHKLSAVIRGVMAKPEEHYGNLLLMGRLHPSVNLALGLSYGELIPNNAVVTYEVRDYDLVTNRDLAVLGRVTVEGGKPTLMPAPIALSQVFDDRATGHLNARFRWNLTPDHHRLGLLSYGFNLYRIDRAFAVANNLHLQPPTATALAQWVGSNPAVRRVNRLPVLMNANDDGTMGFVLDDNGVAEDDGVPFKNGQQFYYFVAARDLLARDGAISQGLLVTICDRVGPTAPRMPQVGNHHEYINGVDVQHLEVTWPAKVSTPEVTIVGYYVYRWNTPDEALKFGGLPEANKVSPLIPHVNGVKSYTYIDNANNPPTMPAAAGKTFWYTVRAVDNGACGPNHSPNSAPAFGVLRDRQGPPAPTGGIVINCCKPVAAADGFEDVVSTEVDAEFVEFDLVATRADREIEWVDFYLFGNAAANRLGRFHFSGNRDRLVHRVRVNRSAAAAGPAIAAYARVGTSRSTASATVMLALPGLPSERAVREARFRGLLRCSPVLLAPVSSTAGGGDPECQAHFPRPGVGTGGGGGQGGGVPTKGLDVAVDLTPGTQEWRLYRRVDDGALTLWKQGRTDAALTNQITVVDQDLPANASTICYFAQLLDEHGNASPMAQIGDCVEVAQPAAQPILAELVPGGTTNAPTMTVRWFCPPAGVERFEVLLARQLGTPPAKLNDLLSPNQNTPGNFFGVGNPEKPKNYDFGSYLTPKPGAGFGPGPQFTVTFPVSRGTKYHVQIRSIPKGNGERRPSNARSLQWSETVAGGQSGPNVPWPARELPEVNGAAFAGFLKAENLPGDVFTGVGIHIANVPLADTTVASVDGKLTTHLKGTKNPVNYVFKHDPGNGEKQSFLPVVLYRYQVPNDVFTKVSGDLVQVSPFMERIVTQSVNLGQAGTATRIVDPFVRITPPSSQLNQDPKIYLLDTQPVMREAAYAYVVVRFEPNGEIRDVVPVPAVTIP
jgi:hypothetical protein